MKQLNERFDGICNRYSAIMAQYDKMTKAFKAFCDEKHRLAAMLMPHDPDEDGGEPAGDSPRPYPTEEDKARIRETIAEVSDADLSTMLRNTTPDLGALNDERRMVFIARTALDEAARRLNAGKESK